MGVVKCSGICLENLLNPLFSEVSQTFAMSRAYLEKGRDGPRCVPKAVLILALIMVLVVTLSCCSCGPILLLNTVVS